MSTSISAQAGPGTRHLRGHAAGSGREAATVDLTRDSEEFQDEEDNDIWDSSDRTMVTFSSFLPLLHLSCTCFLAFLQILYLYNMYIMSCIFSLSVPVLVFFFHRFATVRFGVLLWRPGFKSWFQFGDWFFGSGSIVASGTGKIFPALSHAEHVHCLCIVTFKTELLQHLTCPFNICLAFCFM